MSNTLLSYLKRARYKSSVYLKFSGLLISPKQQHKVVDNFHKLFYDSRIIGKTWGSALFLGTKIQKCPLDLFVYQEILYSVKPDVIVETGTAFGGGALYLASICDLLAKGRVISIDVLDIPNKPQHRRVTYLRGSSTSIEIVDKIKKMIKKKDKVLVILDSNHSQSHVLDELKIYYKIVSKGSYLIVEDTNVNGHPVYPDHGPGPMEALEIFLKSNKDFVVDKNREKFYLTFNPNGYLKRIK